MGTNRASSVLALSPHKYSTQSRRFWQGTRELERFPPTYPEHDEVFEEYLGNASLSPSRHQMTLKSSSGLMELHYDTMRKKARDRGVHPVVKPNPSMDRAYTACAGYSGLIPGKISNNIVGCTWQDGSRLAYETRGSSFDAPMSGMTFTLGFKSPSGGLGRSSSLPGFQRSTSMTSLGGGSRGGSGGGTPTSPNRPRVPKLSDDSLFN
eukprot:TRINITY_DN7781_c0_g1_i1.p1 TRINITY_DN7781_c0_g1~~TRINITY_DN7781_c0_g1_i1.p1  ORF type:complete len:241 (-),score=27.70 TRINITY_DN7781_c0_g1_i1:134-757(-)